MNNKHYQDAWADVISLKSNTSEVKTIIGMSKDTIDLYKGFVQNHYRGALEKMFPRLQDVLALNWNEISQMYYSKFPPYAWDLNDLSLQFANFLESIENTYEIPPYLKELVKYELMEFNVYKAKVCLDSTSDTIAINTSVKFESFYFDIASWVKEMDVFEEKNEMEKLKSSTPIMEHGILCVARNLETNHCVFTKVGGLEVTLFEIFKNMEISKENPLSEVKPVLVELLPQEQIALLTEKKIKHSIDMLFSQSIIL